MELNLDYLYAAWWLIAMVIIVLPMAISEGLCRKQ